MKYEEWSSADLLEGWRDVVAALAGTKTKAALARPGKQKRALWSATHELEERELLMRTEVYLRMGVPADFKKPGLTYYSASKHHGKHCQKCGSTGGMNGRFLHWWCEGFPLAYNIGMKGGTSAQVKAAIEQSELLCNRCAGKAGMKTTVAGKPALTDTKERG